MRPSAVDADRKHREAQAERLLKAWETPKGWRYWSAVNNSEVGVWYTATAFFFMLFAGVLALLMRIQLAVPENDFLAAETYNQAFTLHGTVMMFLFAVPLFEAFSIAILPEMLAARDLPFPRLSAYGFWCFLIGGVFVSGSILFDAAPQGGWFMYPPLTTDTAQSGIGADIWLLGLSFIEVASIAAAVELIVGVLKCRPPGMRINLIPLYAWYILVVAGMIVFAFPPLIAGDLLFEVERAFDWPFFDAERGGDPLLWQHLFWIFGHPEVYIIFLPAIALVAMIVPTFAQRPIFGYTWIVLAAVGTGFLSFGLWVHHMYTTGLPAISLGFFSAASEAVAIPTGVQIFAFIATLLGRTGDLLGADAVRDRRACDLRGGRADRRHGGARAVRLAGARHLLRRRPPALRPDRRHAVPGGGRDLLLLPVREREETVRPARADRVLADVRRLQSRLPADAPDRAERHAAARLHLSGGPRLGLAEPDLDRRRLHLRRGLSDRRLGRPPTEGQAAVFRAQPLERGHLGMADRDARAALGCAHRAPDREPLSALGPEGFPARLRRGTLLSAGCGGGAARNAGHLHPGRRARTVPARGRPDLPDHARRDLHGRRVHLPDLPHVRRGSRERRARARLHPRLAMDRHRDDSRKGPQGRGSRP